MSLASNACQWLAAQCQTEIIHNNNNNFRENNLAEIGKCTTLPCTIILIPPTSTKHIWQSYSVHSSIVSQEALKIVSPESRNNWLKPFIIAFCWWCSYDDELHLKGAQGATMAGHVGYYYYYY